MISLEDRIIEKQLVFAGRVASLELESCGRQAWNMVEQNIPPWVNKIMTLTNEVGLDGEILRIDQRTWKTEVNEAVAERDRRKWQKEWEIRVFEKIYRSIEKKKFEEWLDGRTVFKIRAGIEQRG